MSSRQPNWKFVANLGDADPVTHGGFFVYTDESGVYPPEAECLEVEELASGKLKWTAYRIVLDRCTFKDGVLSDNESHPEHPAWFADSIDAVANSMDHTTIVEDLCSDDPVRRAMAYRSIAEHHPYGYENFDEEPLTFKHKSEVKERYADCL